MESQNLLDPLDDIHLFALHLVYLPRINTALDKFERDWAFHPISTENNRSPRQLWHQGMSRRMRVDPESPEAAGILNWNRYGSEDDLRLMRDTRDAFFDKALSPLRRVISCGKLPSFCEYGGYGLQMKILRNLIIFLRTMPICL